jgi:NAD+ synthase (glutamine-hydrolysing)
MRIAIAQMNALLADFQGNSDKIIKLCNQALENKSDLIVFPELSFLGYPPCDLLERHTVVKAQNIMLNLMLEKLPKDISILLGAVTLSQEKGKSFYNSALLIQNGKIIKIFNKELLPVYDVFDEGRHFSSGKIAQNNFELNGKKVQVLICEDMWGWDNLYPTNPVQDLDPRNCDLILNLSASPFTVSKRFQRLNYAKKTVEHLQAPLVYVNMVGGQDEIIFDGGSFALSKEAQLISRSSYFMEELSFVDLEHNNKELTELSKSDTHHIRKALVLGLRDYITKNNFKKAHIGLSGGIDSAVVACLLSEAIGPENLICIAMPTKYNSPESLTLADSLSKNLNCKLYTLPIQNPFEQMISSYEECFGKKEFSLLHENLQARMRGIFLMAYSNDVDSMLISTGNKSEYATGYSTLYGDMCGGIAPIADLLKEQVYDLAKSYNEFAEIIPNRIITRPPSAELRENQKDSDSLPEYNLLDMSVKNLVIEKKEAKSETDFWVLKQLYRSEFKRWQAPPILKISDHAFGQGRRMPITHKAKV